MNIKDIIVRNVEIVKKRKKLVEIAAGLLIIMATAGVIITVFSYENMLNNERKTIVLSASSPEMGNWNLPEIKLVQGEPVMIKIKNVDTVTHGFAMPEFGIGTDKPIEIKAGHVERVEFIPNKTGTFIYMCTVWCSSQHSKMVGKVIVTEK